MRKVTKKWRILYFAHAFVLCCKCGNEVPVILNDSLLAQLRNLQVTRLSKVAEPLPGLYYSYSYSYSNSNLGTFVAHVIMKKYSSTTAELEYSKQNSENFNNNGDSYCARYLPMAHEHYYPCHWASYIIPRNHPGSLLGVCGPCCQMCSAMTLIKHSYHLCPPRSPFVLNKCLA